MNTETAITINPKEFGLEETKAEQITSGLIPTLAERAVLAEAYSLVIAKDINDPATTKEARELRLKIKENRTKGVEAWHKVNKEFYLRGGQFVDAIKKKEVLENERMEDNLLQIEKHAENLEAERIKALQTAREKELLPYGVENTKTMSLGIMAEDMWSAFLTGVKKTCEDKIEAQRLAEEQRIAQANAIAIHNERRNTLTPYWNYLPEALRLGDLSKISQSDFEQEIFNVQALMEAEKQREVERQKENERLKAEAAEREAELKAEREKMEKERKTQDEQLQKEREEALAKQREIEQNAQAERIAAAKEAQRIQAEQQVKIDAERKERERLEKEVKDKAEAEEKERKAKIVGLRRAAAAPDKTKLMGLAAQITAIPLPEVKSEAAQKILEAVKVMLGKLTGYIAEKVEAI